VIKKLTAISPDRISVRVNTTTYVYDSKSHPRFAGLIGSVEAEPTACLEGIAETSPGSLGAGKRTDSATGAEDIRRRGRNLGTCPSRKAFAFGTM
jgi:hypothetical protein